jgi:hypothetical protein
MAKTYSIRGSPSFALAGEHLLVGTELSVASILVDQHPLQPLSERWHASLGK